MAQPVIIDKDRRSNMATSTMHAPMKKGGAGGAYTWGGLMDVQDYAPVGVSGVQKVMLAQPAPMMAAAPVMEAPQTMVSISDVSQFPALPGAAVAPTPRVVQWGAPQPQVVMPAPVVPENPVRQGVEFDGQHPRNQFARVPRISGAAPEQRQPAIDWSQAGTQAIQQTMLHVAANPVVLGQPVAQHAAVPLNVLRAQPQVVPIQPKVVQNAYPSKPQFQRPMMLQARGR